MTTQTSGSETSIKVVMFNGEKWEWTTWIEKFLARGKAKGHKDVVKGEVTIPKATDDPTKLTSEQKKILKKNEEAHGDLILSMNTSAAGGRVAFNIVKSSKTDEYPDGNAAVAMAHLKRKYEPTTAPAMLKMSQTCQNASLKRGKDPDNFITYMEDLRTRLETMGWKVDDTQFMVKILNSLPDECEYQMNDMEKRIGNGLTIEDVREELNLRFERLGDKEKKSQEEWKRRRRRDCLVCRWIQGTVPQLRNAWAQGKRLQGQEEAAVAMATVMETTLTIVDSKECATSVKRKAIRQKIAPRRRAMMRWPRSL